VSDAATAEKRTPELARLGHVALRTPDLDKSLWFFDDVLGLELVERTADSAYLRAWGDFEHHTLALLAGDDAALDHVAWRTRTPGDVDGFRRRLAAEGVDVAECAAGDELGQGAALRFRSPTGLPYEIYYDVEKRRSPRPSVMKTNSSRVWDHGISPRRLDHVNLVTPDVDIEEEWSRRVLGFRTHEYVTMDDGRIRASWLAVTALAHDLALGLGARPEARGLHHVAFYVDNAQDVLRAAEIFSEHELVPDHGPGRHAISQAVCLYTRDPGSGHRVELYSGSFLVLDPDWEPVEWKQSEYRQWWGPEPIRGEGSPLDVITPC
jgi:biphenyl-2,3-diol 1,2-dioxygenase